MNRTTTELEPARGPQGPLGLFATVVQLAVLQRYPEAGGIHVGFESPRRPEYGDFATNVAFSLAKLARRSPQEVAAQIVSDVREKVPNLDKVFIGIEPVGGFINLRLTPAVWQDVVARILDEGGRFGEFPSNGKRISLEFGSANPTGPLVVVQGRSMSLGDTLANAMRFAGFDVFVEWIINDAGGQLDTLGRSLYARYRQLFDPDYPFPEECYPGEYLVPIARAIEESDGEKWIAAEESEWLPYFSKFGRDRLVAEQWMTAKRFGVHYDLWQSEKELHDSGTIREGIERLRERGHTYESDGALFFRATEFGDDKDRVLIRRDGRPTYFAMDVTYHYQKMERGDRVIDILGPDHHGYIGRLKGLASALGYDPNGVHVLIAQQITLMRGDEVVSMSKRAGQIVTLDEIVDEVGVDAARFFFILPSAESPLTFDLKLAAEQSNENPVYYVQYGHARISSVLRNASSEDVAAATSNPKLHALTHPTELALIRRLAEFPETVRGVAENLAPHRLARYARDVASDFHQFYTECRILTDDPAMRIARLALSIATKSVLARALGLTGVSAPETM
ncbi:MAG TPA: arginine--tRNA ligase [Candidatus Baltobacteraceae bacterium]|jgi:arginyl-tRNA synthetase|nr:arginine--tRNA ligase [Candidatus Baltobacteraceae bacterium]